MFLFAIYFFTLIYSINSQCPNYNLFVNCKCGLDPSQDGKSVIICPKYDQLNVSIMFKNSSNDNHFDVFEANPFVTSNLSFNIFGPVTFKVIKISNTRIDQINLEVFHSSYNVTEEIQFINNTFKNGLENGVKLFQVLKKFKNLRSILISGNNLKRIPAYAFSSPTPQLKLGIIRIVWNHITSIGDKAFYDLDNLTWLDLSGNRIKKIGLDTFAFHGGSEKPIQIDLDQNELTSTSFENGSFTKIHRPTVLYIRSNSIDYLAENIFLPLLKLPSFRLFPHGNNFICDCNNQWILKEKLITQDQFDDFLCEDGQSLWTKDLNDIKFCDLTQEDVKTGLIQLAKFLSTFKIISKAHEKHISSLMKV